MPTASALAATAEGKPVSGANPTRPVPPPPACLGSEVDRLRALANYLPADRTSDVDLDRFAGVAAGLLGLDVGLVNLVGEEMVFIQGRHGIAAESLPRADAFCTRTIKGEEVLSIPDLAEDPEFAAGPLVGGEGGFRFYAGTPLVSPLGGHRIGTLCVLGRAPRPALDAREAGLLASLSGLVMDRLELRRAERARRDAEMQFERMTAAAPGAVVCADRAGRITHWNNAAERLFGWSRQEAIGRLLDLIIPEPLRAAHARGIARIAASGDGTYPGRTVEVPALRRDGSTFLAQLTLSCWHEDGNPVFGASIYDITARRAAEERLRHLAHHDPLTGLINRVRLNELVAETAAGGNTAALVLLDLDGFKHVNDTLGHGAGDVLLTEVAHRLTDALAGHGSLARLGGDEFAALLPGCDEPEAAAGVARAMQDSLGPPFSINGRSFHVGGAAGVALALPAEARVLLPNADLALHKAKAAGKGACSVFTAAMRESYDADRALEKEVLQAVLDGQLVLHYQPQVRLSDRAVVGAEALLRWDHPTRGLLAPGAFLAALEAGPLAGAVGDWTINEACRQAASWHKQGHAVRVGVNLFSEQMRAGHLVATVRAALARWALPPSALELELTERIALRHEEDVLASLHTLHADGVGIALDDFGTGFASLSTLKRCPLTRLKIDRSFVSGLGAAARADEAAERSDRAIIEAVLALGRGLGLGVVAEGIETEEQAALLTALGCDEGQGYFHGRPSPASAMPGLPGAPSARSAPQTRRRLAFPAPPAAQSRADAPGRRSRRRHRD